MFLHLGQNTVINTKDIVGIFDLENSTISRYTRAYLANMTKKSCVVNVSYEMPKSFIVCVNQKGEKKVYISQISSATLNKRAYLGRI